MSHLIKKWAENDFKNDPELILIPSFYQKLKSEGFDFSETPQTKQAAKVAAAQAAALKDPNVVSSQQEEEDIAKAIELSLKDSKNSPKKKTSTTNAGLNSGSAATGSAAGYTNSSSTYVSVHNLCYSK